MSKLTITVVGFTTHNKNTLKGFCSVEIAELHLTINDIGVHAKDRRSWVSLPGKLWLKNGEAVVDGDGRPKFFPILEFTDKATRDAFSDAVVKALREHNPRALDCGGTVA